MRQTKRRGEKWGILKQSRTKEEEIMIEIGGSERIDETIMGIGIMNPNGQIV